MARARGRVGAQTHCPGSGHHQASGQDAIAVGHWLVHLVLSYVVTFFMGRECGPSPVRGSFFIFGSTGINHASHASTVLKEVQRSDHRTFPKRANAQRSGRRVRANPDHHPKLDKEGRSGRGKSAKGLSIDGREELRELRKKLRQLKQERDMLAE